MTKWNFLTGDVNYLLYGGSWYRKITKTVYHVIDLVNLKDSGVEVGYTYAVELREIDINNIHLKDALNCCGWYIRKEISDINKVEALSTYGTFFPMGSWSGNNSRDLIRSAKLESEKIVTSKTYHSEKLLRPVNRLGMTAYEYGVGDMESAIQRGLESGDKSCMLVAKIYGM